MPHPNQVVTPSNVAPAPSAAELAPDHADDPRFDAPAYCHGVRAGETLYIAGQISQNAASEIVGIGDPIAQAEQVWANILAILEAAGGQPRDLVKITVYLADVNDMAAEFAVRVRCLGDDPWPPATLVQVAKLGLPELLMEIDAIAVIGSSSAGSSRGRKEASR